MLSAIIVLQLAVAIPLVSNAMHTHQAEVLSMLALVPLLESEVHGGIACQMAMQVAVNSANNRSDILKNYHLEVTYRDEGEDVFAEKGNAIKGFFEFVDAASISKKAISPIVVGTLSPNGCDFIGAFAHLYNMVELASGCTLPKYSANRKMFPNLYRSALSDEMMLYPLVRFVRDVGKWSKVAIYSSSFVDYDYIMASYAYNLITQENIHVAWFNEFPAVDDNFASLKAANVRIIIILLLQPDVLFITLCQWHFTDITPDSGFVFLMRGSTVLNENEMFDFFKHLCPRDILLSQLRSMFFIGGIEFPDPSKLEVSDLGYDMFGFDRQFDALVSQNTPIPSRFLRGYPLRTRCHDTMLQAILTLDLSERMLNKKNMTLSDHAVFPEDVARIVNQSAANISYIGIRGAGYKRYSERLEFDNEVQQIRQYFPGTYGFGVLLYTAHKIVPWPFNSSSFILKKYRDPTWVFATKPGNPPNDSWNTKITIITDPLSFTATVLTVAIILILTLLTGVGVRVFWISKESVTSFAPLNRYLLLLGCIITTTSAICFVSEIENICLARFSLVVVGLSFINATIFFKLLIQYQLSSFSYSGSMIIRLKSMTRSMVGGSRRKKPSSSSRITNLEVTVDTSLKSSHKSNRAIKQRAIDTRQNDHLSDPSLFRQRDKTICYAVAAFTALNAAILAIWFELDPPLKETTSPDSKPSYDKETDTFVYEQLFSCVSGSGSNMAWIASFLALHGSILLISLFLSYDLRRLKPKTHQLAVDLLCTRLAAINSAVLLAANVLIVLVFRSPLNQNEIVSIGLLTNAAILIVMDFLQIKSQLRIMIRTDTVLESAVANIATDRTQTSERHGMSEYLS